MVRFYVVSGAIVCLMFLYMSQSGIVLFGAEANSPARPRGPGQFHK